MRAILLITLFSFLISCQRDFIIPKDYDLKSIIENELPLTNAIGIAIDLRNDNDKWDYLIVIASKSNRNKIEETLDIDLFSIRKNLIWKSDSLNLILFIQNHELVKILELNRKIGDFKKYEDLILREQAVLRTTTGGELTFGN